MEGIPPGFRFYPTEEELVGFYLKNKLESSRRDLNLSPLIDCVIPTVDIYDCDPSDLPQIWETMTRQKDPEQWIFFVSRRDSEKTGWRPNRLTAAGYWKATGSFGYVYTNDVAVGGKRTMVFYTGRAPSGTKTEWRMNEYTALEPHHHHHHHHHHHPHHHHDHQHQAPSSSSLLVSSASTIPPHAMRQDYSICRVYTKSSRLRSFDRRPPQPPPPPPQPQTPVNPNIYFNQGQSQTGLVTHSQPLAQNLGDGHTAEINASLPQQQQDHHHHHSSSSSLPSSSSSSSGNHHGNTDMVLIDEMFWEQQLDSFFDYI
ncbi:PREDICTED: NAC domain-containing protein 90-like [Tarenaya hassleriana]|uniref:NAC domain-containing protein 90-like n=1 Tax=Tarenaya hassleriana TaxID=28532 RepID=UPI00053CA1E6|nr:PREDICTED: NAC domain-containing protein 90-like [Tarenaya hassleriana]